MDWYSRVQGPGYSAWAGAKQCMGQVLKFGLVAEKVQGPGYLAWTDAPECMCISVGRALHHGLMLKAASMCKHAPARNLCVIDACS